MVADDRSLDPDRVQDADVGAPDALLEERIERRIAAGVEERARDVVVARRQRDRVRLEVFQPIDDRGETRRIIDRRKSGLEVRRVQDLQPVGAVALRPNIEARHQRIVVAGLVVELGIDADHVELGTGREGRR